MSELPPGVDPEIVDDVRRVEQCRRIFEQTHQQIETWEVFCLVMLERDETHHTMEDLLRLKGAGDEVSFQVGALDLFQKLLKMRAKYGKFVRGLRVYIQGLPVGHFGRDTMEMSLGFIAVSPRGRETAQRWMDEPDRHRQDAAGRLEDIINRTMRYQTVLRATP